MSVGDDRVPGRRGERARPTTQEPDGRGAHAPRPFVVDGSGEAGVDVVAGDHRPATTVTGVSAPTTSVREYVQAHRGDLLDLLDAWLRIPGISAQPEHAD